MENSKEFLEKLENFMKGSKHFAGLTMIGCYTLSIKDFLAALEYYIETGKNVLDEHAEITWAGWKDYNKHSDYRISKYTNRKIAKLQKLFNNKGFWNVYSFYPEKKIKEIRDYLAWCKIENQKLESYPMKRYRASLYTSRSDIRKKIFERDGRVCRYCGSTENLTLDHIIPVKDGGKNTLDNLQVLCRSCNAKRNKK